VAGDYCPERPSTDRMVEALAHLSCGWEEVREVVGSPHSLMMIREVGPREANIPLHVVVVVSYRTKQVEGHQEGAGMKAAAHLVPVVGF